LSIITAVLVAVSMMPAVAQPVYAADYYVTDPGSLRWEGSVAK